jgi:hypothetical protein
MFIVVVGIVIDSVVVVVIIIVIVASIWTPRHQSRKNAQLRLSTSRRQDKPQRQICTMMRM